LGRFMERGIRKSKRSCIVIVSESPKCGAMYYADRVRNEFPDYDVRVSILGHFSIRRVQMVTIVGGVHSLFMLTLLLVK